MSIQTETASEYYALAAKAADRGDTQQAIHYSERGTDLLLREPAQAEAPGTVIGESLRFGHLGKVLSEKRRLAFGK